MPEHQVESTPKTAAIPAAAAPLVVQDEDVDELLVSRLVQRKAVGAASGASDDAPRVIGVAGPAHARFGDSTPSSARAPGPSGSGFVIRRMCAACAAEEHDEPERVAPFIRRFAGGSSAAACAECEDERKSIRAKFRVGPPGDRYEQEADRIADEITRAPEPSPAVVRAMLADASAPDREERPIQRSVEHSDAPSPTSSELAGLDLGPGAPLSAPTREFFEPRLGLDFGGVRVHAGSEADHAAQSISARAFTFGQSIAFAKGEYAPDSQQGRKLLAHELVHVGQQSGVVRRQPKPPVSKNPAPGATPSKPKSADIQDVMAFYQRLPPTDINQYFVVKDETLTIYDRKGGRTASFTLKRPGMVDVTGYYLGNPFFGVGWAWVWESPAGKFEVKGLTYEAIREAYRQTKIGEVLRVLDQELFVIEWIQDADLSAFWAATDRRFIAMAIVNTPLKPLPAATVGPVLRWDYPPWFKELKTKVEARIAEDRKADASNPNLPQRIIFYGSDKVQAQRGTNAWTIEVQKDHRAGFLTIEKSEWDAASDKDAYAQQITQVLYRKVQLIVDETKLKKEEEKEITEIDRAGAAKKGSKWGWAVALRQRIEALLAQQKMAEPKATDFPDKLTLATQGADQQAHAYLRIWVYDDKAPATANALPVLKGGTLASALGHQDRAEDWAPIARKAADALRKGYAATTAHTSTEPTDPNAPTAPGVLPPYPAIVFARDMNADRTTATIASNEFRMVIDPAAVHGTSRIELTTLYAGMSIGYSWGVYRLPDELKKLQAATGRTGSEQLVQNTNDYIHAHRSSLGEPLDSFEIDYDWDQKVSMDDLGEGDFMMVGKASVSYPSDWNMERAASFAGAPFTVKKPEDLASQAADTDSDAIAKLKAELAQETDKAKQQALLDQIKELEAREGAELLDLTRKDAKETAELLKKAEELKRFIEDDRRRKLAFSGTKDYDPFLFRLKRFDKKLYALYVLVRQVYDFRYDDVYAINEYTKSIKQQLDELNKLEKRTERLTENEKLRTDLPEYRSVAGLVREEDGNLVPLILLLGYHRESKPTDSKYKMLLFDVTFDSPKKGDMTYAGSERSSEEDAVKSAFVEFGRENKYGNGKVVYRVPKKGYRDQVDSITPWTTYLSYALAVIGIVLLIAGAILSAGALAPGAAAGIGMLVTALGISAGVAGAALAVRNIYKRSEKGTFELDAEFALDVIAIIGAAVSVVGTVGKIANISRGIGAAQRVLQLQRLDRLLVIYGATELAGNAILVGLKVKEDVDAVKSLNLPPDQEDEMMQQIAMEAIQQGAMIAFAGFMHAKDIPEHIQAHVERSRYRSMVERGWFDEHGKPTDLAPPAFRQHVPEPGKVPTHAAQGEQAWKETQVLPLADRPTADRQHKLTVTENGRIIRCSEFCTDLRLKYGKMFGEDPALEAEMAALERRAGEAAKAGDKAAADKVAADAAVFEGKMKQVDDLRQHLFGMSQDELDAAFEAAEPGRVMGGEKSGYKIDDTRIPKRQRRMIDVTDIMTDAERGELGKGGYSKAIDRIGKVMGKKISEIEALNKHWEAARTEVLKGKPITDYTREEAIGMYKTAQKKFWENVRKDPGAVEFLNKHGFEFEGESGAALATLSTEGKEATKRGNITNQERRISLDHIEEKAQGDNWKKALDADNLELMFQNANSWKEIVQVKFGMREKAEAVQ